MCRRRVPFEAVTTVTDLCFFFRFLAGMVSLGRFDRTGTVTESFPGEEGKATLIRLEKLRVWEIENVSTEGELRSAIGN